MTPAGLPVDGPVLVVGTGLMGTSVGLALRRAGVEVLLADADAEALGEAVGRGAGSAWTADSPEPTIVVVAVPPAAAGDRLADALSRFPQATVTDVTSVKAVPLGRAVADARTGSRLVGGHPMAGREVSGPGAARADLLDDRVWVLTPLPTTDSERLDAVRALVATCGAVPVVMDPHQHDEAVALTSHGPQVVASLVAARLADADDGLIRVSGQGLRDVTRIAGSDPALWVEILGANAGPVAAVLSALRDDLGRVTVALQTLAADPADAEALEALRDALARGTRGRARVPGKHGGSGAERWATVPVMVADRPGELAGLFVAAGEAGFNLEDVRIEHVLGRPSGLVELSVRPESGPGLAAALRDRGFDVRA